MSFVASNPLIEEDITDFSENLVNESTLSRSSQFQGRVFNYNTACHQKSGERYSEKHLETDEAANELAFITIESERIRMDETDEGNTVDSFIE